MLLIEYMFDNIWYSYLIISYIILWYRILNKSYRYDTTSTQASRYHNFSSLILHRRNNNVGGNNIKSAWRSAKRRREWTSYGRRSALRPCRWTPPPPSVKLSYSAARQTAWLENPIFKIPKSIPPYSELPPPILWSHTIKHQHHHLNHPTSSLIHAHPSHPTSSHSGGGRGREGMRTENWEQQVNTG